MNGVSPEGQEASAPWVGSPGPGGLGRGRSCPSPPSPALPPSSAFPLHPSPPPPQVFQGALEGRGGPCVQSGGALCWRGAPQALMLWGMVPASPPPDQSGILHEVHQPRHEPEEDPVQEADRRLRREDQCRDQVGAAPGLPASPTLQAPRQSPSRSAVTKASLEGTSSPQRCVLCLQQCFRNKGAST